ncbi:MAG TPA: nucleotidyltransferase domain-containing protein [Anaerolineales bacterium]|nr:nucleotidyltransferase domain-containing protein [Anaerolineales bacterium]
MKTLEERTTKLDLSKFENTSAFLWLGQSFRQILGKPMLQEEVLDKVVNQLKADENLLGSLLFGSLASGTHTWKSDIDLIFVYQTHEPDFGLVNEIVDGIAVQYFFTTLDTLVKNQEKVPYLLHMFSEAKILYDRHGSVTPVIEQLRGYFAEHPQVEAEWIKIKELHQEEKKGSECSQTTIIQRWDQLEEKYSGGTRKRTFFRELG